MEQREIGPLRLSPLGVGTAPMGADASWYVTWPAEEEREAVAAIHRALDLGVNWIDTAPFYGWGRAEQIVGPRTRVHPPRRRVRLHEVRHVPKR